MLMSAMLLVMALSIVTTVGFATAQSSTKATRAAVTHIDSRAAADDGLADALSRINETWSTGPWGRSNQAPVPSLITEIAWKWATDATTQTLTVTGNGYRGDRTSSTTHTYPLRMRFAASHTKNAEGVVSYGVPPGYKWTGTAPSGLEGAWGSVVSLQGNSTLNGVSLADGRWSLYGRDSTVNVNTVSGGSVASSKFVAHTNGATALLNSTALPVQRSQFNAYLDRNQLGARAGEGSTCPGFGFGVTAGASGNYVCSGNRTIRASSTWASGTVKSLVVDGDLVIRGSLLPGGGQLHLYVTGDVIFQPGNLAWLSNSQRIDLSNVFIYSQGDCRTAAGTGETAGQVASVSLKGAMACATANFSAPTLGTGHAFAHAAPEPEIDRSYTGTANPGGGSVQKGIVVYYTEQPGFTG